MKEKLEFYGTNGYEIAERRKIPNPKVQNSEIDFRGIPRGGRQS
jgi:hypothetical protein